MYFYQVPDLMIVYSPIETFKVIGEPVFKSILGRAIDVSYV